MKPIMLSIKPKYAQAILLGKKNWEFRRNTGHEFKHNNRIYLYATAPISKVVGYFEIGFIWHGGVEKVWKEVTGTLFSDPGITEDELKAYAKYGYVEAIKVFDPVSIKPLPLSAFGIKSAPQSYAYIHEPLGNYALKLELTSTPIRQ